MNRKTVFAALLLVLGAFVATAQQKKFAVYGVGFYNLENLFDTCHDVGHNDYEYLPDGGNEWTMEKYTKKLHNMAHVIEGGQYFLFRAKDIDKKGLVGKFDYPDSDSFDVTVKVALVRTNSKKVHVEDGYRRFVDKASSFDFIEYGSDKIYALTFRVVRFALSEGSYECLVTNLPTDEFPAEKLKEVYFSRWTEETSFRKLKYTIGDRKSVV